MLLILPWVGWLAMVHHHTQVGLFTTEGLADRIVEQAIFYLQRLPDQVVGPFVEVGTVLHRSPVVAVAANFWAAMATGIMVWGWIRTLRTLAGGWLQSLPSPHSRCSWSGRSRRRAGS